MNKTKNIAIYYRYNAKLNDDSVSTDFIIKSCRDFAVKNNCEIFDVFYDDSIAINDSLQDLIDIIQTQDYNNRLIDAIIVYNYSMLCKSINHMQQLFNSLENQALQVFSIEQPIESKESNSTLINIIYKLFNEFEVQSLKEINEVNIDKKSGTPPFGYTTQKDSSSEVYIDNQEADIVKDIFSKTLEGWSAYKIAKHLNERGFETKKGSIFRTKGILDILQNPTYAYGYANSPSIIDKNTFDKVKALINTKGSERRKKENPHLFSDILRCPQCNGPMVGNVQSRKLKDGMTVKETYYKCYNWHRDKSCNPNSLKEDNIRDMILDLFYKGFNHYFYMFSSPEVKYGKNPSIKVLESKLEKLKKTLDNLEMQSEVLTKQIGLHKDSKIKKRFLKIIEENQIKINNLEDDIIDVQQRLVIEENKLEGINNILIASKNSETPKDYYNTLPQEEKKEILSKIIKYITIDKPSFKEYRIIDAKYNFETSIREVGDLMGVTEQEIRKAMGYNAFHLYNGDIYELLDSFIFKIISNIYHYKNNSVPHSFNTDIDKIKNLIIRDKNDFVMENKVQPYANYYRQEFDLFDEMVLNPFIEENSQLIENIIQFTDHLIDKNYIEIIKDDETNYSEFAYIGQENLWKLYKEWAKI